MKVDSIVNNVTFSQKKYFSDFFYFLLSSTKNQFIKHDFNDRVWNRLE